MRAVVGVLSLIWKLYVGIVFFTTALLLYPVIFPFLFKESNKKKAFKIFVFWSWLFRIVCFYHVRRMEVPELPNEPHIILANHMSYLDIFLMYSIHPNHPFLFLGKKELLKYPLIGTYFRRLNIPVYRDSRIKAARSLIQARQEVRKGWSIVIFPEGGIPDLPPKMVRFKAGAFRLAKDLELPIVSMTYINNHRLFTDPERILGVARPGISKVVIHPTISAEEVRDASLKDLSKRCFDLIEGPLLKEYPELNDKK